MGSEEKKENGWNRESAETLKQWIEESDNIVFFGGAGVSTESGIPDFRSVDGLYHQQYKYPPETIISHSFYLQNPEEFYRFYKDRMIFTDAKPNRAHRALAKLEERGKLKAVTGFTRRQAAKRCWSFTDRCTGITVHAAGSFTPWMK